MRLRGVVRTAELREHPTGSDRVEMLLGVQGVGPGQPRSLVIPFEFLVDNHDIEPEAVAGRGFEADAEAEGDGSGRWVVVRIAFASRVLRTGE